MSRTHQVLIVFAIAASALIGAVSGIASATLVSGALQGSRLLSPVVLDGTPAHVQREIGELLKEEDATIAVVDEVSRAVVSVVIKMRRGDLLADPYFSGPFFFPEVEILSREEAEELIEIGGGTGFFVSADGFIVTNRHVVNDEGAVYSVVTNDGVELSATVVAMDPFLDLAILDVEGEGYPTVSLGDSDQVRIGQTAIAIGNTLSEFRNTVTKGVISGIDRRVIAGDDHGEEVLDHAIQTDAAINPGNSGGPLINLLGEVVGVNTAVSFEGESLGFAIPVNDIKKAVDDVQRFGRIIRPWLGVRYEMIDADYAEELGLSVEEGALLVAGEFADEPAVAFKSPAEAAGLKEGDVIVSVEGTVLTWEQPLGPVVSGYRPGDLVTLDVVRGEEQFQVDVVLGEFTDT